MEVLAILIQLNPFIPKAISKFVYIGSPVYVSLSWIHACIQWIECNRLTLAYTAESFNSFLQFLKWKLVILKVTITFVSLKKICISENFLLHCPSNCIELNSS